MRELEARAVLIRERISLLNLDSEIAGIDSLCKVLGHKSATRVTIILPLGKVIGDTDNDPEKMENHGNRPEVQEALSGKIGIATRYSHTLYENMMYVAIPLLEQNQVVAIVRVAQPITSIDHAFGSIYPKIIAGGILIAILAALTSLYISRRLTNPLVKMRQAAEQFTRGDFTHRLPERAAGEIGELARTMNQMAAEINEKVRTIVDQKNEREAILSSMVEGVIAVDNSERVISLNREASQMLGVNLQDIPGRLIQESFRSIELHRFIGLILESGEAKETEISVQEKSPKAIQLHGSPLLSHDGRNLGAVIILHDVTRLHQLETIRRDFVANVSHELRTPITSIKGFVETLRDGRYHTPEDVNKFLEIIARQTDRLNSIIGDLLTLSELEQTDKSGIRFEPTQIKSVLESAILACELKAQSKNIEIRLDCDENLAASLNAPLLEQAVVNLIDNAIKYSESNGVVDVAAKLKDDFPTISVIDHGCGIEKAHIPRLFERFYRVDRARSRDLGGTGLGLSIVRHIVLAHGGHVDVVSSPGKAAHFPSFCRP